MRIDLPDTGTTGHESSRNRETDPVIEWRVQRLLSAGIHPELAGRLAQQPGLDLHALLDLLDRGCPVRLALRIIDPYDAGADAP